MKILFEMSLENFEAWSGGKETMNELTHDELESVENLLEETAPEDGWTDTGVNDFLWFERDFIAEHLGYRDWEHLERAHNGEDEDEDDEDDEDEDVVRVKEMLAEKFPEDKFPGITEEYIDEFITYAWEWDKDDDFNIGCFINDCISDELLPEDFTL